MTEGNILKQILLFTFPLLLGNIFQQLYNTVDVIVVGRYVGKEALAAVGASSPIITMLVGFFTGLSTGASAVIAQFYGSGDVIKLRRAIHTSFFLTIILSVLFTIIGVLGSPYILELIDVPPEVFTDAVVYLRIYFFGIAGVLIYNMTAAVLRAVGDSKRPLYFLCFASLLNVVLDIVFVVVLGMGISGVAWATFISQALSAALCVILLIKTDGLVLKEIKNTPEISRMILAIGFPGGLQQLVTAFSNVMVQAYINQFGAAAIAGYSAYLKIDSFYILPMQSISLALVTYVGQNAGAGKIRRAREGVKISAVIAVIFNISTCVLALMFGAQILSIFSPDPEVIEYGNICIKMLMPLYFTLTIALVYAGAMRGFGEAVVPMMVMIGGFVVLRQIYLFAVSKIDFSFAMVQVCYPFTWVFTAIFMYAFYKKGKWSKKFNQIEEKEEILGKN